MKSWDYFDIEAEKQGKAIAMFGHGKNGMGIKKINYRFTKRIPQSMPYNEENCNKFVR